MYLINKALNEIQKIEKKTFRELGFREREHLQEWLDKYPEALGEPLLIIGKEFDGFSETQERLDLLALDKQGNLVIIENKLDDAGRNVTWQALKYASYCASLDAGQIRSIYQQYLRKYKDQEDAEARLAEFFEDDDYDGKLKGAKQRIMMVAGEFRKEVTSTVLWLLNFGLKIQCFKATPFQFGEQLLLNIEQVIPVKDAEDFIIRMANKNKEEINSEEELKTRYKVRLAFWDQFLKRLNTVSSLGRGLRPAKKGWLGIAVGLSGINLCPVVTRESAKVELYINRGEREENEFVFDFLSQYKDEIDQMIALVWERNEEQKSCRIKRELAGVSMFNKNNWATITDFLVDTTIKMEEAFREPLAKLTGALKQRVDH